MRIVNKTTFLSLPAGTAYSRGEPWVFGSLSFKDESLDNDWWYCDPTWVDANDSGEAFARLDDMLVRGSSYPMDKGISRDGRYQENDIFLVFEAEDLERLAALIENARSVTAK